MQMGLPNFIKKCFTGSTHNINVNIVKTNQLNVNANGFLSEFNKSLLEQSQGKLSAQQLTHTTAINYLKSMPPEVCNRPYLNEIVEAPVWNEKNGSVPCLVVVSSTEKQLALCYFEISADNSRCTIHLLCSNYKPEANGNEPQLKLGALLMRYVITLVAHLYKDLKEVFLIAETESASLPKLVNYYQQFNFIPVNKQYQSGEYNISQQRMVLNVTTCQNVTTSQNAGANKKYVKYQNRKYLVRLDGKKKQYIISKGETVYLKNVKHTKLHV
jgi:hypothetical protein